MSENNFVEAIYNESDIEDYAGNPMIEALPPLLSYREVVDLLKVYPSYNYMEREHSDEKRFQYIQRLFDFFQPLDTHYMLQQKISTVIKQGYIHRDPLDRNHVKYMNESYKSLMKGELPSIDKFNIKKRVQGFSIIGISGIGKTSTVDRILNMYPQVIRHTEYKGQQLTVTQIPWLKLECPPDGSTKGLCITFFRNLDDLLGTNYFKRYQSRTRDTMLAQMGHLSRLHNIGVLIIDEIQHLSLQKSGGADGMLNFFVTLVNYIGIPVILIGTNKSFEILNQEFRQALRSTGQGSFEWKRMQNDIRWEKLLNNLFRYQWTRQKVEFTDKFREVLYEESQGILGIAIKIFAVAQMEAILNRTEQITPSLIKQSAAKHFPSLRPMLDAIKSGSSEKLNKYEDLRINMKEKVSEMEERLELNKFLKYEEEQQRELKENIKSSLNKKLAEKISDSNVIQQSIKYVLQNYNLDGYEIEELYEKALENAENKLSKKKSSKTTSKSYAENDLRQIKESASNQGIPIYRILKDRGIIQSPYDFSGKGED